MSLRKGRFRSKDAFKILLLIDVHATVDALHGVEIRRQGLN